MQREAMQHVDDPAYLRQQLKELLDEEEAGGMLNAAQRSKKKTLQMAYEAAIKKQIQAEAHKKRREAAPRAGEVGEPVLDVSKIPLPSMPPPLPPVVSGASTVVARPKAQHDVALTSMVPSSVVRRPVVGGSTGAAVNATANVAPDSLEDFLNSVKSL